VAEGEASSLHRLLALAEKDARETLEGIATGGGTSDALGGEAVSTIAQQSARISELEASNADLKKQVG